MWTEAATGTISRVQKRKKKGKKEAMFARSEEAGDTLKGRKRNTLTQGRVLFRLDA